MDCNKGEAIRAKEIAVKKIEIKDFVGARKVAIKAQQLFPALENISQLIVVCDVHCAAENKVYGNEKDWYGILNIESTADEASIKKQFRRFALLLHPDKNKFSGAADAFKLIGEAQKVLLDREKRRIHDALRRSAASNGVSQRASRPSNVRKPRGVQNRSGNQNKQFPQPQQKAQTVFNNCPTFWTACPFCLVRFQYYRSVLNKLLECQSCKKSFIGYEVNAQGTTPQTNLNKPAIPKQKDNGVQDPFKVGTQSNYANCTTKAGFDGNVDSGNKMPSYSKTGSTSEVGQGSKPHEKCGDDHMSRTRECKSGKPQPCGSTKGKKRKKVSESSESCNTESSSGSEEDIVIEEGGYNREKFPRRSTRSKRNVTYTENMNNDNDVVEPSEGVKSAEEVAEKPSPRKEPPSKDESAGIDAHTVEDDIMDEPTEHSSHERASQLEGGETEKSSEKDESAEDVAAEPEFFECPDPDFNDFDKDREERCFAVGQIWAIYDTLDAMPRFYAQIRKVLGPKFKLRITWLEANPDEKDEIKWVEEDLPVSCGKFRQGKTENTEDHKMFSHLVSWEKGRRKDTYSIYPRKGQIWALFKNWDMNWSSDPDNKTKYEYEFVEVLSDYAAGIGVSVAYLGKVKGYACLFCRMKHDGVDSVEISSKELFRFSHMVPSFQMTGKERNDIPKGSFELDPASLPTNLEEIEPPAFEEIEPEIMNMEGLYSTFPADSVEPVPKYHVDVSVKQTEQKNSHSDANVGVSINKEHHENPASNIDVDSLTEDNGAAPASPDEAYEIPDPEFYNFDADKSIDKLEIGQIWALYCDEDGLPKYYGKISKIDRLPEFIVHISWLSVSSTPKDTKIPQINKKMPICCGRFKLKKAKKMQYSNTASFSHQVKGESTNKKEEYDIFPRRGEIWALYKTWDAELRCSDLVNCTYDMVEVLEDNDSGFSVLFLELVSGFKSVFRPQVKGQLTTTMTIPHSELLRFSHQIPAFRLTEERSGSLRGCLELDPAALPVHFFSSS